MYCLHQVQPMITTMFAEHCCNAVSLSQREQTALSKTHEGASHFDNLLSESVDVPKALDAALL